MAAVYKYDVELKYVKTKTNEAITFDNWQIKSIIIERDIENNNMPMIFLTIAIDKAVATDMVNNQSDNLMNLTMYKLYENSDLPKIKTTYFQEQFVYFIHESSIQTVDDLDYSFEEQKHNEFENISIGLLKLKAINDNKTVFNKIISNCTMINAIQLCTQHMPMVIEPLNYNNLIQNLIIPPVSSVAKVLRYLNDEVSVFYTTPYRYFIDFDYTYLLSTSGKATPVKGSNINTIIFESGKRTSVDYADVVMEIDKENKAYLLKVNEIDIQMNVNRYTEKSFNKISATSTEGMVGTTDLNVNNSSYIDPKTKFVRVSNNNTNLLNTLKNGTENNSVAINITKENLDVTIFTPNKEYIIKKSDIESDAKSIQGKMILVKSQELYIRGGDDSFSVTSTLSFKYAK